MPNLNGHGRRVLVLTFVIVGLSAALLSLKLQVQDPYASRQYLNAALTALGTAGVIASRRD